MEKHDQLLMKKQNKSLVLEIIKNKSPISRMEIAKMTGMSPTSISRIVNELHQEGFVKETELVTSGVGRKAILLDVCDDVLFTVGVELDKTVVKMGIVNYVGEIIHFQSFSKNASESYDETIHSISSHVKQMINENAIPREKIIGLAIGLPGLIDYQNGIVRLSEQLQWKDVPLAQSLSDLTSLHVVIDNELKMKAVAESAVGIAKGAQNSILVGIGTGIGSAIILNGEIYRGESNIAGEIGHTVVDPNGNVCSCGKIGCLSTYISERAILEDCRKVTEISTLDEVFIAFHRKESWALNILDRAFTYIALGISNLACFYNPEIIILSGDLLQYKIPEIKRSIEEKCERYMWEPIKQKLRIVYSNLGDHGVVLGAAIQAQNTLLEIN